MPATNTLQTRASAVPYFQGGAYPFTTSNMPWQPLYQTYGSGTAAGSIDQQYQAQLTVGTTTTTLTLNGGTLTNQEGDLQSFARVDYLGIYNSGSKTATVGGTFGTNILAPAAASFEPQGFFELAKGTNTAAGIAVGAGAAGTLTFTASGTSGTTTFQLLICGRSA